MFAKLRYIPLRLILRCHIDRRAHPVFSPLSFCLSVGRLGSPVQLGISVELVIVIVEYDPIGIGLLLIGSNTSINIDLATNVTVAATVKLISLQAVVPRGSYFFLVRSGKYHKRARFMNG
jgi:hypothetical protein